MEEEILQQEEAVEQEQDMLVEAPESVSEPVSQEGNTIVQPEPLQAVVEPPRKPSYEMTGDLFSLDSAESYASLESVVEDIPFAPRNTSAQKELLQILKEKTGLSSDNLTQEDETELTEQLKEERNQRISQVVEQNVANAETSEEVIQALLSGQAQTEAPISLADTRIASLPQLDDERFTVATDSIREGLILAQEFDRVNKYVSDEKGLLGKLGDLLELSIPVVGYVTEATYKAEDFGLDESQFSVLKSFVLRGENVDAMAQLILDQPVEKRNYFGRALREMIFEQETMFFKNGNSFLMADRIEALKQAVVEGSPSFMTDEVTTIETLENLFGILDIGFEVSGAKGLKRGLVALLDRLYPKPDIWKIDVNAFRNAGRRQDAKTAADPEAEKAKYTSYDENPSAFGGLLDNGLDEEDVINRAMPKVVNEAEEFVEYKGAVVDVERLRMLRSRLMDYINTRSKKGTKSYEEAQKEIEEIDAALNGERLTEVNIRRGEEPKDVTPPSWRSSEGEYVQSPDELGFSLFDPKAVNEDVQDITSRMLVTDSADSVIRKGKQVERNSGATLKHNPSMTLWKPNDIEGSIGDFKLYFGDGNGGYETKELAEIAAKLQTNERLPVRNVNGKWYVEYSWRHTFDPTNDVSDIFDKRIIVGDKLGLSGIRTSPTQYLGSKNLTDFFALRERGMTVAYDLQKDFTKLVKGLRRRQIDRLNEILYKGDMEQKTYTRLEAENKFGKLSNREWEAYLKARRMFDIEYEYLNQRMYNRANAQGVKRIVIADKDEVFDGVPRKLSDVDRDLSQFAYDTRTGKKVLLDDLDVQKEVVDGQEVVVRPADENAVVVRVLNKQTIDGETFEHVVVRPEDVRDLPPKFLSYRDGHVNRSYKDVKYVVRVERKSVVDGVERAIPEREYVGLTTLKSDAEELAEALRKSGKYGESDRIVVDESRENKSFEDELQELELMGFKPSAAKHRGELLQGPEGKPARIDSPLESLAKSALRIESYLNADIGATMRQRFTNTFKKYLLDADGKPLSGYPTQLRWSQAANEADDTVKAKIKEMFDYINSIDEVTESLLTKGAEAAVESLAEALYGIGWKEMGRNIGRGPADLQKGIMSFTTQFYIVSRLLFQVPTNLLQGIFATARYPKSGSKALVNSIQMATLASMRGRKDFDSVVDIAAKAMGYSKDDIIKFLDFLDETGIVKTTGQADDFLSQTRKGAMVMDSERGITSRILSGVAKPVVKPVKELFRGMSRVQSGSIKFGNLVASMAEFDEMLKAGTKWNAKTKADLLMRARRLTFTQNGLDKFKYQRKEYIASMAFQYLGFVHKFYTSFVLEPYIRAIAGDKAYKKFLGGREESIYAETRKVAITATAFTLTTFGLNGSPIGPVGSYYVTNELRELLQGMGVEFDDDVWTTVQGGLINLMFKRGLDIAADVTGRITPAGFISTIAMYANNLPQIDLMGASAGATGSVLDIYYMVDAIAANEEIETSEQFYTILRELSTLPAGFSDLEKAWIAYNMGQTPYARTLSGVDAVNAGEAIAAAFSIPTQKAADFYNEASLGGAKTRSGADRRIDALIRGMNIELSDAKANGTLNAEKVREIFIKWNKAAIASEGRLNYEEHAWKFRYFMLGQGENFQKYVEPFVDGKDNQERLENLRVLLDKEEDEAKRSFLKRQIEAMESIISFENKDEE